MNEVGERIREARTQRGWTLETLASRSGLSTGFLSQVERGLSTLSIVSLAAICRALDLSIAEVFSASGPLDREAAPVTRRADQLRIQIGDSPIVYRYLTGQLPAAPIQELLIAEFPPSFRQDGSTHEGREVGYVLEGRLTLVVDGDSHELRVGDSYRIAASEAHGYRTHPGEAAKVLMAVTERFIELPPKGA